MSVTTTAPAWLETLAHEPAVRAIIHAASAGGPVQVRGACGSSTQVLAALLARSPAAPRGLLLITAHQDDADESAHELASLDVPALRLPVIELEPGGGIRIELVAERLAVLSRLAALACPVVVAAFPAIMQETPTREALAAMHRTIRVGDRIDPSALARWLGEAGLRRTSAIENPGEYAQRGDIVDVFPPGGEPVRIDFFGDEVEGLFAIDLDTMGSDARLPDVDLVGGAGAGEPARHRGSDITAFLPDGFIAVLAEPPEIVEQGRAYWDRVRDATGVQGPPAALAGIERRAASVISVSAFAPGPGLEFPVGPLPEFAPETAEACRDLLELAARTDLRLLVQNAGEADRAHELIRCAATAPPAPEAPPRGPVDVEIRWLHRGCIIDRTAAPPLALVPYHEVLHRYHVRRGRARLGTARALDAFTSLEPGDFAVHRDHGIGRYLGLRVLEEGGEEHLVLEFAKNARLNVPASRIDLVQRYVGASGQSPELATIGGRRWKIQKAQAQEAVRDLAAEMLRLQALRASMPGIRYPADTAWQREFEAEFPYEETEDQLAAIAAVKRDMMHPKPMDRLICGDVGFGKTEIAIRAAFKAVESGRQVAVLVPTTVLCEQHERTFRARLADYPFRVESVSRFRGAADTRRILDGTAAGQVDILIGTHRLLSPDVHFRELGLVVIDEEQRFGVEHKQRLLGLRATADILTLSATPIPRTLHMALLGIRDISSLTTPPLDRRAIVTDVIPWNPHRIRQAIERELAREGQVFFVSNRVHDIHAVAAEIGSLVPAARILVGHGQMKPRELERVMLGFVRGEADILVSTTIIESGIDIPRANTMIIRDADMFGLAELHQLRGRVGRSRHRAYCYLLLPRTRALSDVARRRLEALEGFSMLGAGFRIALRDLELRGAGNLLGAEQSGHIAAVGYEMYCRLLEQEVESLRRGGAALAAPTIVDLRDTGSIPGSWIAAETRRLDAYRRIALASDAAHLERLEQDLVTAYGPVPKRARILLELAEIRILATQAGIRCIRRHDPDIVLECGDPAALARRCADFPGTLRVVEPMEGRDVPALYWRPPARFLEPQSLRTVLRRRLAGAVAPSTEAGA
ncbi:MAG: transcription-repair coupling factor [Phycisphaeraceae bacterium]|nr:transcription-repair coupling factor [Phycisphaeraceae bacterium]